MEKSKTLKSGRSTSRNGKLTEWYVADFETTSYETYQELGYTRVWLWAICDSNGKMVQTGSTIDSFMDFITLLGDCTIYFHNLKFDGSFILNWLLDNDFKQIPITDHLRKNQAKRFSCLIDGMGAWYQVKVNLSKKCQVQFLDSLKLIPLKVKEIAKAFNLPIEKEVIDYSDYAITPKSLHYIENDVKIPAMGIKFFKEQGYDKMTIGSSSYNSYVKSNHFFDNLFPSLDREWLIEWRLAYRGGRAQVNPTYQNKILHNIKRYDSNSMYPYMLGFFEMPYGKPMPITRMGFWKFELYCLDISFRLKKGHLPTLLKDKGLRFTTDSYYMDSDGIERIYISNLDYDLLIEHYDIDYCKFVKGYGFATSDTLFRDWIMRHYKNKQESTGGLRMVYKLILNNLYGKFGSNPRGCQKVAHLDDNGGLLLADSAMEDLAIYYLPVAIAVTSWAHKYIDDAICATGYDNFVYCDTDSVHTLGELPKSYIDQKMIGKFKLEAIETDGKYIQQKRYIEKDNGQWHITCAGMNDGLKQYLIDTYGDDCINQFKISLKLDSDDSKIPRSALKLIPKQVKGGCVLVPTGFYMRLK